jgi:hypothetical protein
MHIMELSQATDQIEEEQDGDYYHQNWDKETNSLGQLQK